MIITKSLNSYRFYHRGYVCSVGSALKLSLDTYSIGKIGAVRAFCVFDG